MSNINIFQNNAKTVPMKADDQIVRVDLDKSDIGGRKSHLPAGMKSGELGLSHVPNAGSTVGK
jgi:hypothetical protein